MADRTDFYFRQKVTEAELDLGFELLERADRNLAVDIGLFGVVSGAVPTQHSPLADISIDLTGPGRAYDKLGQRVFFGAGQTVSVAADSDGLPTDVPQAGQERWIAVFVRFKRSLWDPRTDGNSQQVMFRRDESFEIVVRQGALGAAGAAPRVALVDDELLLCDVHRTAGQTQILAADIDTVRRQAFIFAKGDAIGVVSGLWSQIVPVAATVQAALDAGDAWLAAHLAGQAPRRHKAKDVDFAPHAYVASTDVQGALNELMDDLQSSAAGAAGGMRVGAAGVAGSPVALSAGTVATQIAALLVALNAHLGATQGAHPAAAITTTPFAFLQSLSVQAMFTELVNALASNFAGSAGTDRIGGSTAAGKPNTLPAGSLTSQLATLLGFLNTHLNVTAQAHPASAITVGNTGGAITATDVAAALIEIVSVFGVEHYRGPDAFPGQHKTIHQPPLGTGHVVLWDSNPVGAGATYFEVSADATSVWFTLNARWNGTGWQRVDNSSASGGFRLSRNDFAFLQDSTGIASFSTWGSTWTLPMSNTTVNAGFETTGPIRDTGRIAIYGSNTSSTIQGVVVGGSATFRNRFAAAPTSITLASDAVSASLTAAPYVFKPDRDGFSLVASQPNATAASNLWWVGRFTAIA